MTFKIYAVYKLHGVYFFARNFFTSYNEEEVNDSYIIIVLTSESRP